MKLTTKALALTASLALAACTSDITPEQSVTSETTDLSSSCVQGDSLALVALYQELGGEEWYSPTGWLSDRPVAGWTGVEVEDGRVVALTLVHKNLHGTIPTAIGDLTALRYLNLSYNADLTGDLPEELYSLTDLEQLKLAFTSITGQLSESIGQLAKLDTLDLWTSKWRLEGGNFEPNPSTLTGAVPRSINALKQLRYLRLGRHKFTSLPDLDLPELTYLDAAVCDFHGDLPEVKAPKLETLYLSHNAFTGRIPAGYGELPVRELFLSDNDLSGALPESFAHLTRVEQLSLHHNQFSGGVSMLTELPQLYILYLGDNAFTGVIPTFHNPLLIYLGVENNHFTGIEQLPEGRVEVDLSGNDF